MMKRHYYISESLDDLAVVEHELEICGVTTPQIHVLSQNDAGIERRHLHNVQFLMKKDIIHSTEIGALIGLLPAALVLTFCYFSGLTESVGWFPVLFLSVLLFAFCTWEGGLLGIQKTNYHFQMFKDSLEKGKHLFFVDLEPRQEAVLENVLHYHPRLKPVGTGTAVPGWIVKWQNNWHAFIKSMP